MLPTIQATLKTQIIITIIPHTLVYNKKRKQKNHIRVISNVKKQMWIRLINGDNMSQEIQDTWTLKKALIKPSLILTTRIIPGTLY